MPRAKNNGNRAQRRMPVKRSEPVPLSGEFEGWDFVYRMNPPMGEFADQLDTLMNLDEEATTARPALRAMTNMLKLLVLEWNFVDEQGEDLPLNDAGFNHLPDDLIIEMFNAVNEGVREPPLAPSET